MKSSAAVDKAQRADDQCLGFLHAVAQQHGAQRRGDGEGGEQSAAMAYA